MIGRHVAAACFLVVGLLGGCSDGRADGRLATHADLTDRTFRVESIEVGGEDREIVAGAQPASLAFTAYSLRAATGCDVIGGTYTLEPDSTLLITVGPSNWLGCGVGDSPLAVQHQAFDAVLGRSGAELTLDGDQIVVSDGDTVIRARLDPDAEVPTVTTGGSPGTTTTIPRT